MNPVREHESLWDRRAHKRSDSWEHMTLALGDETFGSLFMVSADPADEGRPFCRPCTWRPPPPQPLIWLPCEICPQMTFDLKKQRFWSTRELKSSFQNADLRRMKGGSFHPELLVLLGAKSAGKSPSAVTNTPTLRKWLSMITVAFVQTAKWFPFSHRSPTSDCWRLDTQKPIPLAFHHRVWQLKRYVLILLQTWKRTSGAKIFRGKSTKLSVRSKN